MKFKQTKDAQHNILINFNNKKWVMPMGDNI